MNILGVTRVRNEAHIIQSTLDHFSEYCKWISVLDEASTDNTVEICKAHPNVTSVIELDKFEIDPLKRREFESWGRQMPLDAGLIKAPGADWILYMDADERLVFDVDTFDSDEYDVAKFRLFDYYITNDDVGMSWEERTWIGPEYRNIPMLFRKTKSMIFKDRVLHVTPYPRICERAGDVKHYGKAISVNEWEKTCRYYIDYRVGHSKEPLYFREKWERRIGRAVHTNSSFNRPLIKWEDRNELGIELTLETGQEDAY